MKALAIPLLLAVLFSGCKKDKTQNKGLYLVSTITYTDSRGSWTDNFTYDDQNRISGERSSNSLATYTYAYNNDNTLASVSIMANGALEFIDKFRYTADSVLVQQYAADGITPYLNYAFVLNGKQVVRYIGENNYTIDYTRDSNGNVTTITGHSAGITSTETLQYDDKKSPFADIGLANLHVLFMISDATLGGANNRTKTNWMTTPYVYQYLDNGLPSGARTSYGQSIKFEYITK
ncbi:hypothetical protein [Mucilaginibacter xinganensis]|uniref:YD repeat-containing protein n=1 Tax=Mucilaginibacter xinganensis TaxID=1234841 RepID=A0A223NRI5_9SPHI|nr:hypothetical protein [Mucilaginibacter xinganensis]ASU32314.1 hypothetical protein MuYL_0411 [Mucilaginibacter xinganensis]